MLNGSAMRIEWDDHKLKEIDEAKSFYLKARQEGRRILDAEGNEVRVFKPSLKCLVIDEIVLSPDEFSVRVLDETGDRRLIWNANDQDQVKEAAKLFKDYMGKGWKAYATNKKGDRRHRIHAFDWKKEEVSFDDKGSVKEKFRTFISNFRDVKLVPKTYPG